MDPVHRPLMEMTDDVAQPAFRLDPVQFAASDKAVHDRHCLTTTIFTEEQAVTATQRHYTKGIFIQAVVDFHPAVAAEDIQSVPVVKQISERLWRRMSEKLTT